MKFNDKITLDIAKVVQDVMEGKVKKEEVKYPHKMYHPENGKEVEVKDKAEHEKYAEKGYVHEKPKVNEVEEPKAKGEKDFKDKHVVKKSGEKEDGTVVKETTISIDEAKKPGKGKSKTLLQCFQTQRLMEWMMTTSKNYSQSYMNLDRFCQKRIRKMGI